MSERILTTRELNRALLARQLLLERPRLPVARAVERVAGLQAQDPQAPYVGLWTRVDGLRRQDVTRALHRRRVVKATLMRATLHLVSARDYALFLSALLPSLREYWRRYVRNRGSVPDVERLARRALAFADRPRSAAEMRSLLGGDDEWWRVRMHAPFIHAPTGEGWAFGRRPAFVSAESWLARPLESAAEGAVHLLRRYLRAFGPATLQDAVIWSGLTLNALRPAAEALSTRLRRFRDERGRLLLDLRGAPLPDPDTRVPPRLLPAFDNALLSHVDRTRILSDDYRRAVIRGGLVDPVVLVDGFVCGRWRLEGGNVRFEAFEPWPRSVERELRREGERLAAFAA
jgi:Winged helix DNA-binding domain